MPLFSRRHRPMHLGKYPMERIRRVPRPTTHIGDDVPRVPKRANFFNRAAAGDLGPVARRERLRKGKSPLAASLRWMSDAQRPLQEGEPAGEKAPLSEDPAEVSRHVKSLCYFLDADMVGICEIPHYAWYSHREDGTPIEPYHRYAVVLVIDQGFDTLEGASGDDWVSASQSQRAYLKGSTIACTVADYIRRLGYPARAHTSVDSDVLHLPLTLLAGVGELSRIGELVLNPFLGPRFKTTVVTTDLPLETDRPVDFGLQDFCGKCRKCAVECPCNAISFGAKIVFNGYEMWKPDVLRCTLYRVTNPKGHSCGRCMKMCPFNKEGLLTHRAALWLAIKVPWLRGLLARLDDWLGYGRRSPAKRWWWDLEYRNGRLEIPARANQRDLDSKFASIERASDRQRIAIFPAETMPPPDHSEASPIDRRDGEARAAEIRKSARE